MAISGQRRVTSEAYLVYVALDEAGRPQVIPAFEPSTEEERAAMFLRKIDQETAYPHPPEQAFRDVHEAFLRIAEGG